MNNKGKLWNHWSIFETWRKRNECSDWCRCFSIQNWI